MHRDRFWPYSWLGMLFVIAISSQATFTVDVIRDLSKDYRLAPVRIGDPWPAISQVYYGQAAGLRVGDRVATVDGRTLQGWKDLAEIIRGKHAGDSLRITTWQGDQLTEHRVA